MNKLTDRLQLIADQINTGETMADIGTDHGFLPLHLFLNGISPRVIMCDISEPSLAKARVAFAEFAAEESSGYSCGKPFDFRAGDGLKVIEDGEVDDIVIAGMGGLLIKDILSDNIDKTRTFRKLILQPRNNSGQLRYWLFSNDFTITHNLLVREGKFICEVIVAEPSEQRDTGAACMTSQEMEADNAYWDCPHELLDRYPTLGIDFANIKLRMEEKIRDGIMKSCNVSESDIRAVEKRIDYYKDILNY